MAITAAAVSIDRIYRSDSPRSVIESAINFVDTTITFSQGDLCYLDTSAHLIKVVASTANSTTFLGISPVGISSGVLIGPYTGLTPVTPAIQDFEGPIYSVVARLKGVSGDAWHPGDKAYLANGSDSQSTTSTDPSNGEYIGIYVGATIASATTGQDIFVKLVCRYPAVSF